MPALIDTHAHLHDEAFAADRAAVLARAHANGIGLIVTVGADPETSAAAVALASAEPEVYAAVGVHPHDAHRWDADVERTIRALAGRAVAIGEIGLDFYRTLSPPAAQRDAFAAQLALADSLDLPVVVHSRDAHEDTEAALTAWARRTPVSPPLGVLHCFSGDAALALRYAGLGFVVSFAGPVTYPKNHALREAAAALPADAFVVETDCPYLAPQPRRGRRNEPAYLRHTLDAVAAARGQPPVAVAAATTATARRLFRLPVEARITP